MAFTICAGAVLALSLTFIGCPHIPPDTNGALQYRYEIVTSYPHDRSAFTQGFEYVDGLIYEGTGLYGQSSLRRAQLESGEVLFRVNLAPQYFGEGITVLGGEVFQLTWTSGAAFVYDRATFTLIRQHTYSTQGWGLTNNGVEIIMSDGSPTLYFRDPATFAELRRVTVRERGTPVSRLNELEYIDGEIWANVWLTNDIVRIDPETGVVIQRLTFANLLTPADLTQPVDVLNGIAYDAENGRLFLTGKLWPRVFEVRLIPLDSDLSAN